MRGKFEGKASGGKLYIPWTPKDESWLSKVPRVILLVISYFTTVAPLVIIAIFSESWFVAQEIVTADERESLFSGRPLVIELTPPDLGEMTIWLLAMGAVSFVSGWVTIVFNRGIPTPLFTLQFILVVIGTMFLTLAHLYSIEDQAAGKFENITNSERIAKDTYVSGGQRFTVEMTIEMDEAGEKGTATVVVPETIVEMQKLVTDELIKPEKTPTPSPSAVAIRSF